MTKRSATKVSAAAKEKLEALHDWVIGEAPVVPDKTPGGIVLTDTAKLNKRPQRLRVLAVGPGKFAEDGSRIAIPLSPGDEILVPEYGVVVHDRGGDRELRCYRAEQVLGQIIA